MKRKRHDSSTATAISNVDLIKTNPINDQKRNVSFEYRPGQFLRNEIKSSKKLFSDEKEFSPSIESAMELKRKRFPRATTATSNGEEKKSPFVWKPTTISTIQTRRSSKNGQLTVLPPEENSSNENQCRTLSNSTTSNSVKPPPDLPPSEVLIFRPIIRFVESESNGSPKRVPSSDEEIPLISEEKCCVKEDDDGELQTTTDSRSSSRTSTDNVYLLHSFDSIQQQSKSDLKSSCFLETPPPSLPDTHLTQESESPFDKQPIQQLKSKRKQDRPQRKQFPSFLFKQEKKEINGVLNRLLIKQKEDEEFSKTPTDLCDPGYLSDEYGEPTNSNSDEIHFEHEKKVVTRGRRLTNVVPKTRTIKTKRLSHTYEKSNPIGNESFLLLSEPQQQLLFSPSSPSTPTSTKFVEQQSNEDLLSPNFTRNSSGVIEQLTVLPKERDVYEIIHCECQCQIDNGFMIQCETCLCWSHCECVGVTATCIPAFFKCNLCTKAEADRPPQSSLFDDDPTSLFLLTPSNAEKLTVLLTFSRRLWDLREQMSKLKLRSTPTLRTLQNALRTNDLIELSKYANIQSDRLTKKIDEREKNRVILHSVAETIDEIVDRVSSQLTHSSCLSIEFLRDPLVKPSKSLSESMEIFISRLCDDEEIREIRLSLEHRYQQMISTVDQQMQTILNEHQKIVKEMKSQFTFLSNEELNRFLSFETHETALKSALERLKSC